MFLRGTRSPSNAVAARASSEHDDDIAWLRTFAAHMIHRSRAHHCADFETLGLVIVVIYLAHVRRGQTDLVAVGRIAGSRALGDHRLGQLALHRRAHRGVDVACTRHAQCLIHVAAPAQRVADGTAHARGRPTEGLYLRRMVMGFILEHQQPRLGLAVHLHIDVDAARVVLFRNFHVFQIAGFALVLAVDARHVHERLRFLTVTVQLFPHRYILIVSSLQLMLELGGCERDFRQLRLKGRVAAMVAPVGVQQLDFRIRRISFFLVFEIFLNEKNVFSRHGQTHLLAKVLHFFGRPFSETVIDADILHVRVLRQGKLAHILLARFHLVNAIFLDLRKLLRRQVRVKDIHFGAFDHHFRFRVEQREALHRAVGTLVELAGQVFHCQICQAVQRKVLGDGVHHRLRQHAHGSSLQQGVVHIEDVVHHQQAETADLEVEITVQGVFETDGFYIKARFLFNENTYVAHNLWGDFFRLQMYKKESYV